jgi:3-phenylpropionate/trans-cinnamate dioxygenase ferredoxin subunit
LGYVKVAETSEMPEGTMKIVHAGGIALLLTNIGGSYYAINNTCTHMGGSLGLGTLAGNVVTCPRDGSKFDVTTGRSVGPWKLGLSSRMPDDEKSYPVMVDGTAIMVDAVQTA